MKMMKKSLLLFLFSVAAIFMFSAQTHAYTDIEVGTEYTTTVYTGYYDDCEELYFNIPYRGIYNIKVTNIHSGHPDCTNHGVRITVADQDEYNDYDNQYVEVNYPGIDPDSFSVDLELRQGEGCISIDAFNYGDDYDDDDDDTYISVDILVTLKSNPLTDIKMATSGKVTLGFSKKIKVTAKKSGEKVTGLTWSSSNKKIATVDSKGNVKGKKAGTCTITCKLKNGKKHKCKITVRKNHYKNKKTYYVDDYPYSEPGFEIKEAYYKGNTLVTKIQILNNRMFKISKFDRLHLQIKRYNPNGSDYILASKKWKNLKVNIKPYSKKTFTLKFKVKKKYDLFANTLEAYDYDYLYTYVY